MKNIWIILFCLSLFISESVIANTSKKELVERIMISLPGNIENEIESFMLKPLGDGPFPVIFLLHGYQLPENSLGGKQLVNYEYLDNFAR